MNRIAEKLILTDVDEVVLRWADAFTFRFRGRVDPNLAALPEGSIHATYDIGYWLGVDQNTVRRLLDEFHHSAHYSALQPYDDARQVIPRLAAEGCRFIGITACGSSPEVRKSRMKNLEAAFGPAFEEIIAFDYGASKRECLASYPNAVWVEDNVRNAMDGFLCGHRTFLVTRPANFGAQIHPGIARVDGWHDIAEALLKPSDRLGRRRLAARRLTEPRNEASHEAMKSGSFCMQGRT